MAQIELTEAEKTFFLRMGQYLDQGMDFRAAGEAVLADDDRLMSAALATDGCDFIEVNGEAHTIGSAAAKRGVATRSNMARETYRRIRAA